MGLFWFSKEEGRVLDKLRVGMVDLQEEVAKHRQELRNMKLEAENIYQQTYRMHEKLRKMFQKKAQDVPLDAPDAQLDLNAIIRRGGNPLSKRNAQ